MYNISLFKCFQKKHKPINTAPSVKKSGVTRVYLNSRALCLCRDNILPDIYIAYKGVKKYIQKGNKT